MLTILCVYHSLVSSERFHDCNVFWNNKISTGNIMTSSTATSTPAPPLFEDTTQHLTHLDCLGPSTDCQNASKSLSADDPNLAYELKDDNGKNTERPASTSKRDSDSSSLSYHDARSSMSPESDVISVKNEEEEEEKTQRVSDVGEDLSERNQVDYGSLEEVDSVLPCQNFEEVKFITENEDLLGTNVLCCEGKQMTPSSEIENHLDLVSNNDQQCSAKMPCIDKSVQSFGYKDKEGKSYFTTKDKDCVPEDSNIQKDKSATFQSGPNKKSTSAQGRLSRLGKAFSPGQYQSVTLGRPGRKACKVSSPVPPNLGREDRSKTEPPPELAPPDLLQVSWVWETRPTVRSASRSSSVRRRPSRKVSCRRRSRPLLAPRKLSGSRGSSSPNRKISLGNHPFGRSCSPLEEKVVEGRPFYNHPDVLSYSHMPITHSNRLAPYCDTETVLPGITLDRRAEESEKEEKVPLRQKRYSNYLQSASTALRQKWRSSEIVFPKFISESIENLKNSSSVDSDQNKKREFLEKAKALPLQMKKLSKLMFNRNTDYDDNSTCYASKGKDNPNLFFGLKSGLASRLVKRRKNVQRPNGASIKRQGSFSPRNSFKRSNCINWSQKYQNAISNREKAGTDIFWGYHAKECSPIIRVTEVDNEDEAFVSEDDTISTEGSVFSRLHPQFQEQKGGVFGKLLRHIRARSLSTNRSFASSRSSMSGGSEDGHSPSHSSDYEDQDDNERSGSASLVGRMRGLRRDMQKKISRLKSPRGSTSSSPGPLPGDKSGSGLPLPSGHQAASSYESLPSTAPAASSTAIGSNRSSLSGEEAEPYTGPFIGRARALVDCQPSPYDRDALKFKKGDIIDIIAKNPSGLWKGCVDGRVGHFKFILVEEEVERPTRRSRPWRGTTPRRGRAHTLEELLTRLHLGHLIQVFVLNGYEDLEQFRDVEKADLDCLGITDPETCAKILTAVALLHDADSEPEDLPESLETTEAALRRGDHGRDSGCYTDHRSTGTPAVALDENNLDTRQSTPSTDTSSGYHSRGAYNIPLGEATLTSRDDHSSALDSPSSESAPTSSTAPPGTNSEPHSYRAHLATVLPASPRAKLRHGQQGETKQQQDSQVDFEAKYVTARSVFEKELVKREVPFTVRSPKRNSESHSPTEEIENRENGESNVAVTEDASP